MAGAEEEGRQRAATVEAEEKRRCHGPTTVPNGLTTRRDQGEAAGSADKAEVSWTGDRARGADHT